MVATEPRLAGCIESIKTGRKLEARTELIQLLKEDPQNAMAWQWLSVCCNTVREKRLCLEKALTVSPGNEEARHMLEGLRSATSLPSPPVQDARQQTNKAAHPEKQRTGIGGEPVRDTATPNRLPIESNSKSLWIGLGSVGGVALLIFGFTVLNLWRGQAGRSQRPAETSALGQPTRDTPPTWTPRATPEPAVTPLSAVRVPSSTATPESSSFAESATRLNGAAIDYMPRVGDLPDGYEWEPELTEEYPSELSGGSGYTSGYRFGNQRLLQITVIVADDTASLKAMFEEMASRGGIGKDQVLYLQSEPLDIEIPYADKVVAFEVIWPGKLFPSEDAPMHVVLMRYKNVLVRLDIGYTSGGATLEESEIYAWIAMDRLLQR